ncbi:MAG: hypothetical protein JWM72_4686, partial [Actinomycetia bacterium]|nr:hypothetical protein [Actinomycetes bacterium]
MTPDALATLCAAAMPEEHLTVDELTYLCFGPGDEVIGVGRGAAVLQIQQFGKHVAAWLSLVAVEPSAQRGGLCNHLVH